MKKESNSEQVFFNRSFDRLEEDVMGFLNEVQLNFPEAVSFASGRPDESYFDLEGDQVFIDTFVAHLAARQGMDKKRVREGLCQYNRSKGVINDLVVKYLCKDWGMQLEPDETVITVGTQEGLALSVAALCNREEDVILIEDPCYIGISHFSILLGYQIAPVKVNSDGICLNNLEEQLEHHRRIGKRVKLVYVIPDFQNPTGFQMSVKKRVRLLEMAEEHGFMIIEDNAYGDFVLEGNKLPTLKSLDGNNNVIYLHSFSKVVHPSLRLSILASGKVFGGGLKLVDLIARLKGYTTVNTPSLTQAILGGMLLANDFSFQEHNREKVKNLSIKKEMLLQGLESYTSDIGDDPIKSITWSSPKGGYFLTLTCPFEITKKDVIDCACSHKVIFTPMSFFYMAKGGENQIRLAYSYVNEKSIDSAVARLADFLALKSNQAQSRDYIEEVGK